MRAARRLSRRSVRAETGRFLVEGPQAVRAAAAAGVLVEVFCTVDAAARLPELTAAVRRTADAGQPGRPAALLRTADADAGQPGRPAALLRSADADAGQPGLLAALLRTGDAAARQPELTAAVPVHVVTDAALASLAETVTPQGVVAVCRSPLVPAAVALAGTPRLVAVLAEIRDPGNAGTVVRCADAAGADAVLLSADSVDPLNGKSVRASAGSLFHLPIAAGEPLPDLLAAVRAAGCQVLATATDGDLDLDDALDAGLLAAPTAWVLGNEAHGLRPLDAAQADHVVRIPLHGRAESLNLAAAAAVCLYASARAHRRTYPRPPLGDQS